MVEIMAAEPALHGAVTSVSFEAAWYASSTRCTLSLFGPYLVRWTWTVFASAHVAWLQIPPSPFQCWRMLTHPYEVCLFVVIEISSIDVKLKKGGSMPIFFEDAKWSSLWQLWQCFEQRCSSTVSLLYSPPLSVRILTLDTRGACGLWWNVPQRGLVLTFR